METYGVELLICTERIQFKQCLKVESNQETIITDVTESITPGHNRLLTLQTHVKQE